MGMHAGVLAVRSPMSALKVELEPLGISFGSPVNDLSHAEATAITAFEAPDASYINDGQSEASANGDFIVELSRRLDTLVVGCGEESASGTFWFFAANRGQLLRACWAEGDDVDAAFDEGDWLVDSGLARNPEYFDMFEALERAGFDYGTDAPGTSWILTAPDDGLPLLRGPITKRIEAQRGAS